MSITILLAVCKILSVQSYCVTNEIIQLQAVTNISLLATTNIFPSIVDIKRLGSEGKICEVYGHLFGLDTQVFAVYPPRITRTCKICGLHQTRVEEWK